MKLQTFFSLAVIYVVKSDDKVIKDISKMMGIGTVHRKIDKDSIISRHTGGLKITRRGKTSTPDQGTADWSYSSFPEEVKQHANDFKRNMTECLKEVQANDKRETKRLSPTKESPVHGECLIACVLRRNGVIEHGKVRKENLLTLVRKFYAKDMKMMKKLETHLDRCIDDSARGGDECAVAARLNACTNDIMANTKQEITVNY